MAESNATELVARLSSNDDSVRKMAAFKLQSEIGDPSFADTFMAEGGLKQLRNLSLNATGNTLAYTLSSFSNLLEMDQGWDLVDGQLTDRLVKLVVDQPLVNILRGALSMLVAVVSHPDTDASTPNTFGFRALQPTIESYPQFLEMLVDRLSSADHGLCANALQLINSLMRDAVTNDLNSDWPRLIKRLQDLGVINAVYTLIQSSGLQDLVHPLLEFQTLTKILLVKWREIPLDLDKQEHRRALKAINQASNPEKQHKTDSDSKAQPKKWRRLGFDTEAPQHEFQDTGYLGMMDLTDFIKKNEEGFQNLLLEQSSKSEERRCPIAKASLAVTSILYDHFEVEGSNNEDTQRSIAHEQRSNFDKAFKPLLLQWSRLHTSGVHAFMRFWDATCAESGDFNKIEELVRILIEHVVGLASRTKDIVEVEEDLADYELNRLRDLQMELLELTHEDAWGLHLRQVKDELRHEALQFMKEQRIRCLLAGAWFPNPPALSSDPFSWRFARLSHNRRFLHYADFAVKPSPDAPSPSLDSLTTKIDLSIVSSVVSNVTPTSRRTSAASSTTTLRSPFASTDAKTTSTSKPQHHHHMNTKITVYGHLPTITIDGSQRNPTAGHSQAHGHNRNQSSISANGAGMGSRSRTGTTSPSDTDTSKETPLLSLHPPSHTSASEWLDGLLLLLNQAPITAETNKLVDFMTKYGLRIRLLNVRFDEALDGGGYGREVIMPGREGLDEDYYYEIPGL